jgi:hypothetical protein
MTYASLKTSAKRWVRQELAPTYDDELPALIDATERKVARVLKTLMTTRYVDSTMQAGLNVYEKPSRWLDNLSFQIRTGTGLNDFVSLEERTYEFCSECYPDQTVTDEPRFYADFEFFQYMVFPTPAQDYPFRLGFYERPEPLSDSNQQNLLTQLAPELMLYGLLVESAIFITAPGQVETFKAAYSEKLAEFGIEDKMRITPRAEKVMK